MNDTTGDIVTLTIALDDVEPRVWRRLEVPADYSFDRLHQALNAAMGWLDLHLHEFEVAGKRYGTDVDMSVEADATLPEMDLVIGDVARAGARHIAYWYDFGDDWWHTVEVEAVEAALPGVSHLCTAMAGELALPRIAAGRPASTSSSGPWQTRGIPSTRTSRSGTAASSTPTPSAWETTSALLRQVATGELPADWG